MAKDLGFWEALYAMGTSSLDSGVKPDKEEVNLIMGCNEKQVQILGCILNEVAQEKLSCSFTPDTKASKHMSMAKRTSAR